MEEAVFDSCGFFDREGLVGSVFRFCDLKDASFKLCDLSLCQLNACVGHGLTFLQSRMRGASFEQTSFAREFGRLRRNAASFGECALDDATLRQLDLSMCSFRHCSLRDADLSRSVLAGAELTDCDLYAADFNDADLSGADLRRSLLDGFDLTAVREYQGLQVSAGQQHHLLNSIGIEVAPEEA